MKAAGFKLTDVVLISLISYLLLPNSLSMMRITILTISILVGSVAARQPYDWLDVVGQFSKE
jgi:hypothetical protein